MPVKKNKRKKGEKKERKMKVYIAEKFTVDMCYILLKKMLEKPKH